LERRIRESQHRDPAEETDSKLDSEIKNLTFKVKYLETKIAEEEQSIVKLQSQKYQIEQRVGQQNQKESDIIHKGRNYGVDFDQPESVQAQTEQEKLREELLMWQRKTDVVESAIRS